MELQDLRPSKVVAVHLNYRSRAQERGRAPAEASYFLKPPSSLARGGGPIERPAGCALLNYEGEIAIVLSARLRHADLATARRAIGWLSAANDFGLYDMRWADRGSNLLSKGQDGYTPIGPRLTPAEELDLSALVLRTRVNGEIVQEDSSAHMLFPFEQLVADLSRFMTLEAGDVILTGTPANSRPVAIGDVVEVELENVGTLRSEIVEGPPLAAGLGAMPRVTGATRAMALGGNADRPVALSTAARQALRTVSTATLTVQLRRRGIRNTFLGGLKPTRPDLRLLGYAHTLRYVAQREDVVAAERAELNAQKATIEALGPDDVLVIDARGEAGAGTIGDILATRAAVRGARGIVTDGGVRDTPAVSALDIPTYYQAAHGAVLGLLHLPLEANVPVTCAGVLVMPGDVMVGDAEGVMVVPAALAEEVAMDAVEQEEREAWALERVAAGESIRGVYPVGPSRRDDFERWRSKHKQPHEEADG